MCPRGSIKNDNFVWKDDDGHCVAVVGACTVKNEVYFTLRDTADPDAKPSDRMKQWCFLKAIDLNNAPQSDNEKRMILAAIGSVQ